MKITDEQVNELVPYLAKNTGYNVHSINIAYEWFDAQTKVKTTGKINKINPLRSIIQAWGKHHITQLDIDLAAELHPEIKGKYPRYNIGRKLVLPDPFRLRDNPFYLNHLDYTVSDSTYSFVEKMSEGIYILEVNNAT